MTSIPIPTNDSYVRRMMKSLTSQIVILLMSALVASTTAAASVIYSFEGTPANQSSEIVFVFTAPDYLSLTAANNYQISVPCTQFFQKANCIGSVTFTNGMANSNYGNQDVVIANSAPFLFDPEAFVVPALHYSQNYGDPTENSGQLSVESSAGPASVPEPGYSTYLGAIALLAMFLVDKKVVCPIQTQPRE